MAKYKDYTDQNIIECSLKSKSMAELLRMLGLQYAGGNYANMKRNLQRLNLSCEHWTGQGWNKNQQLKDWTGYTKNRCLKKHLIKETGNKCQNCGNDSWMGKPISLDVHHADGDRTNNSRENLKLLCPNCHAMTPNYKGRNIKKVNEGIA